MSNPSTFSIENLGPTKPSESKYTPDVVTRIGNQITTLLKDSALGYNPSTVSFIIHQVVKLDVTCSRGVELVTKAVVGNFKSIEVRYMLIQAVLLEMCSEHKSEFLKHGDIMSAATKIEAHLHYVKTTDLTGNVIETACSVIFGRGESISKDTNFTYTQPQDVSYVGTPAPDDDKKQPSKIEMLKLEEDFYRSVHSDDEFILTREYGVHPISKMPMQGTWVLRNYRTGEFIDSDRYRLDLVERNNLKI